MLAHSEMTMKTILSLGAVLVLGATAVSAQEQPALYDDIRPQRHDLAGFGPV